MAPIAEPEPKFPNPLAPIQNNWDKIEPWHNAYMNILGSLGTIFAVGSVIALIAEHKWKLPKWPFTHDRWNPKPNVDDEKPPEVTEEDLIEDELAEIAAGVGPAPGAAKKESRKEMERIWADGKVAEQAEQTSTLSRRDEGEDAVEKDKDGFEEIKEEVKEIIETAKEVGKEIWEDVKGIFGEGKKEVEKTFNDTKEAVSQLNKTKINRKFRRHFEYAE